MNEMRKLMEMFEDDLDSEASGIDLDDKLDTLAEQFAHILMQKQQDDATGEPDEMAAYYDAETAFDYELEMFQNEVKKHLEKLGFF